MPESSVASEMQSHESIRKAAEAYISAQFSSPGNEITISATKLDRRLRLSQCSKPLEAFAAPGKTRGARKTVGVRCTDSSPWSLYVPVTLSIRKPIIVARHALDKGRILTLTDIRIEKRDVAGLHHGYLTEPDQIVGQKLKRRLRHGDALSMKHLSARMAVKRGDKVVIYAKSNNIQINMDGKALEKGAVGERIKVVNSSSGKELEAAIIRPGVVEVAF